MEPLKSSFISSDALQEKKIEPIHPSTQSEAEATPKELKSVALAGIVLLLLTIAGFCCFALLLITFVF